MNTASSTNRPIASTAATESTLVVKDGLSNHSSVTYRLAILTVCLIWPLIWVGGLVTTYDAGMAVPDWPNTYGYNLFLYPYKTWLLGPFDLFVEHGHRLLGAMVGFVAIALVIVSIRSESRRWVKVVAVVVLLAVILQGLLGGVRVLLGDRTFAMIHGCTAPIVFVLSVAAAVVTSRWWIRTQPDRTQSELRGSVQETSEQLTLSRLRKPLWIMAAFGLACYAQLIFGAKLRHLQPTGNPSEFLAIVWLHVVNAFILWLVAAAAWLTLRRCGNLSLSRPCFALIALTSLQILLGICTWVVNYGFPSLLDWFPGAAGYVIQSQDYIDAWIVTAHVATGSLILAVSTFVWLRILRTRYLTRAYFPIENARTASL